MSEYWWEEYSTEAPFYVVVNLTSITTLVTPYVDTTLTNFETHVYTTNRTVIVTDTVGYNPAFLMINNGPQPFETTSRIVNSTQIVTAGVTVQSPVAFWVYSSVKVITVPAVTDSHGNTVCQTTSFGSSTKLSTITATTETVTADYPDGTYKGSIETLTQYASTQTISYYRSDNGPNGSMSNIYIIPGINSNAEAYFGGYSISGIGDQTTGAITGYLTETGFTATYSDTTITEVATTEALQPLIPLFIRSDGETFVYTSPLNTGQVVIFPTPFVYLPSRGASGASGEVGAVICDQTGGNENYGYVPQTVIDYMASVPAISNQFPGIASCIPGGPSILHPNYCAAVAPTSQSLVGDLTSGTVLTIGNGQSQFASSTTKKLPAPSSEPFEDTTTPVISSLFNPQTSTPQELTASSTGIIVIPPPLGSITTSIPKSITHSPIVSPPTNTPSPLSRDSRPTQQHAPSSSTTSDQNPPNANIPESATTTQPSINTDNVIASALASAIASAIGATHIGGISASILGSVTTISGSSFVILPSVVTIPVVPSDSSAAYLEGQTTILSGGTTAVIVTGGQTIPIMSLNPSILAKPTTLPDGMTAVVVSSGATVPVDSAMSVFSWTTDVSVVTGVVVVGTQTITVSSSVSTSGSFSGSTNTPGPIQIPSSGIIADAPWGFIAGILGLFICRWIVE